MNVDAGRARYRPPEWDATIARVESYTGDRAAIVAVTTSDGIVGYGQLGSKDATGAQYPTFTTIYIYTSVTFQLTDRSDWGTTRNSSVP